jgi:hypothetical protein
MVKYPYLLPNLVSAVFLISSALVVILGLEEVNNTTAITALCYSHPTDTLSP